MSFAVTKTYDDGTDLTEAQLDTAFSSIETLINTTQLGTENLQAGAVDDTILASSSVSTAKVQSAAITLAKLAADVTAFLIPTGAEIGFGGTVAPTGWLMCDGSAVSRATYSALFGVIGTKHGSGDTTTTFNVPDWRGRFIRGADNGAGRDVDAAGRTAMAVGGTTGDAVGSIQGHASQTHTHTVTDPGHTHSYTVATANDDAGTDGAGVVGLATTGSTTGSNTTGITLVNHAATGTHAQASANETRPVNAATNFIIKY